MKVVLVLFVVLSVIVVVQAYSSSYGKLVDDVLSGKDNYYQVLNVSQDAADTEIKKQYRRLTRI